MLLKAGMNKQTIRITGCSVITALLSTLLMGSVHADDTDSSCVTTCAADLKECRKQADIVSSGEAHPFIVYSSANRTSLNGLVYPLATNDVPPTSQNDEIQKRKMSRNQECAKANSSCLNQCSPTPSSPKISVILR